MSIPDKLIELIQSNNPFYYLGPVPRRDLFFDRQEELKEAMLVCRQVTSGGVGGVLVLGGRGSGKTSFLDELQNRLTEEKIVSSKLPLDEEMVQKGSEKLLFNTILQELLRSAVRSKLLEQNIGHRFLNFLKSVGKIENVEVDFPGFSMIVKPASEKDQFSYITLRDGLMDFLRLIDTKGANRSNSHAKVGAIVLLDEADGLTKNENLLRILRSVFQEVRGIGLVLAGSTKLLAQVSEVFSPAQRFFYKIELGPYPNDVIVDKAINTPIDIKTRELLLDRRIRLEVRHSGFDKRVRDIAGRSPLDINMLGHFSFKIGAQTLRKQGDMHILTMMIDKEILEDTIQQLRGTAEYGALLSGLDECETNILKILSKSTAKLSIKEISLLSQLDEMQESLQVSAISQICTKIRDCSKLENTISSAISSLQTKSQKFNFAVLGVDSANKYEVEDHWIRAYFRYGWESVHLDIQFTDIPFVGVKFFGDSIGSIFHSIFFARLSKFMERDDIVSMKAHYGNDEGYSLHPSPGMRLLILSYKRTDDRKVWHIAFNIKAEHDIGPAKGEMEEVAKCLTSLGFISEYRLREDIWKIYSGR